MEIYNSDEMKDRAIASAWDASGAVSLRGLNGLATAVQ
jgi:hypothetical protein